MSGVIRKVLWELRMCSCPITDEGVQIVANNCPGLATLICEDCNIKGSKIIHTAKLIKLYLLYNIFCLLLQIWHLLSKN